ADGRRRRQRRLQLAPHQRGERLTCLAKPDRERLEVRLLELARAGIGARVLAEEHHVAGRARVGAADSILELRAAERAEGLRGAHAARARLPARAGDVAPAEVEGGVER